MDVSSCKLKSSPNTSSSVLEDTSDETRPQDNAEILITNTEDGVVEFVCDGAVYRVRDLSAFNALVAEPCQAPTRSASSLVAAQRADREVHGKKEKHGSKAGSSALWNDALSASGETPTPSIAHEMGLDDSSDEEEDMLTPALLNLIKAR